MEPRPGHPLGRRSPRAVGLAMAWAGSLIAGWAGINTQVEADLLLGVSSAWWVGVGGLLVAGGGALVLSREP